MSASPFAAVAEGVRLRLKVTPRARREGIEGLAREADGSVSLKVAVTAAPEDGRANAAVIALLAREWRLPRSTFSVLAGASGRRKTVRVAGKPDALMAKLRRWLGDGAGNSSKRGLSER